MRQTEVQLPQSKTDIEQQIEANKKAAAKLLAGGAEAREYAANHRATTDQSEPPHKMDVDAITTRLERHDSSVLSFIPATGYKDGVAGVFRDYRLHINNNGELYYQYNAIPEPLRHYRALYKLDSNADVSVQ